MYNFLTSHTFLHVTLLTWVLQLLYVAVALAMLYAFMHAHTRTALEVVLFVVVMAAINIAWRLALR